MITVVSAGKTSAFLDYLLGDDYDRHQRPPCPAKQPTDVSVGVQIENAYWYDQELTVVLILTEKWHDQRLANNVIFVF